MPELPEVHTTVSQLNKLLPKLAIKDVWSGYDSSYYSGKINIKNKKYFKEFKKEIVGRKIKNVDRYGKYILINLTGGVTILTHMKMTGHYLFGKYRKSTAKEKKKGALEWIPDEEGPLRDPFNRFIYLVFTLSNGKHLVLSDMRKFATVFSYKTKEVPEDVMNLGPCPLKKEFTFSKFLDVMSKTSNQPIKTTLMNQKVIAGIGNIYSDEILWASGINPKNQTQNISRKYLYGIYKNIKTLLKKGVSLGGDSMSDYRTPDGTKGGFQYHHKAYQREGEKCPKRGCNGVIKRIIIGGRSTHFCPEHQKMF